jgi:hypothetical protein
MKRVKLFNVCLLFISSATYAKVLVKGNDVHIHYLGRVKINTDDAE